MSATAVRAAAGPHVIKTKTVPIDADKLRLARELADARDEAQKLVALVAERTRERDASKEALAAERAAAARSAADDAQRIADGDKAGAACWVVSVFDARRAPRPLK